MEIVDIRHASRAKDVCRTSSSLTPRGVAWQQDVDRYQQAFVCCASAISARLPSASPVHRFSRASHSMTAIESEVRPMPLGLASGASAVTNARIDSKARLEIRASRR